MRVLFLLISFFSLVLSSQVHAKEAQTKVVIGAGTMITGISAVSRIVISESDIQAAISNKTSLDTDVIARACIFTNDPDGDYNLTITSDKKFVKGSNFLLYNANLKNIKVDLLIYSNEEMNPIEVKAKKAVSLTNHSDPNASGSKCANQLSFFLRISSSQLRKAEAGTYDFAFNASASPYDNKGQSKNK